MKVPNPHSVVVENVFVTAGSPIVAEKSGITAGVTPNPFLQPLKI